VVTASAPVLDPDSERPASQLGGELPADVSASLEETARSAGLSANDAFRQAMTLIARYRAELASGAHFGAVSDASRLDLELTGGGTLVTDLVRRLKPDEHEEDRRARLRAEQRGALLDDIKNLVLFVVLLLGIAGVASVCTWFALFAPGASAETQRWAQTMLAAIVSGAVSFLFGRRVGTK
jgi:hypothetical protein